MYKMFYIYIHIFRTILNFYIKGHLYQMLYVDTSTCVKYIYGKVFKAVALDRVDKKYKRYEQLFSVFHRMSVLGRNKINKSILVQICFKK